ncbi:hypothetical protein PF005_g10807 [Phytophthora fragariae]|uniref:RxLR effector protein n=1 Tax=Phytophthora fragariae TaxID=53985 RepID=A0A6A3TNH4_9STRA|nr:hypothetical protein PF003_g15013 [Phytophthora fragariae]KAE8940735.1 hypothetical protein PF009_g9460 [Phytophthora fragariae]KAE9000257.1 hypothetical protein PF011_g14256 [Phytophthora fragariae]KAE9098341.1 hypothetical protein PF010_g15594 [Phytophthora fragariae]KAE9102872.1 hypothetical protein PF007_g14589 [Phytophthora fragariae]
MRSPVALCCHLALRSDLLLVAGQREQRDGATRFAQSPSRLWIAAMSAAAARTRSAVARRGPPVARWAGAR